MKTWNTPEISELNIAATADDVLSKFEGLSEEALEKTFYFIDGIEPNGRNNGTVAGYTLAQIKEMFGYGDTAPRS